MSAVDDMLRRYKEIRQRLMFPPNAVPDTGINLKRHREPIQAQELPAPELSAPILLNPSPPPPPIVEPPTSGVTFSSTLSVTAKEFGLSTSQIRARSRIQKIVFPRQVAIYLAAKQEKWSMCQIACYLNLDHTTILYAQRKIASKILSDPELQDRVKTIEAKLAARYPSPISNLNQPALAEGSEGALPQPSLSEVDSAG